MKRGNISCFGVLFCVVFLVGSVSGCSSNPKQKDTYLKGIAAYEKGDYPLALSYFKKTDGYEDTETYIDAIERVQEISMQTTSEEKSINENQEYYESGVAAYNAGDYDLAKGYFEKAGNYNDSAIYLQSIYDKTVESTIPMPETPSYLIPKIVKDEEGKEYVVIEGGKLDHIMSNLDGTSKPTVTIDGFEYIIIYYMDMNSNSAQATIVQLLEYYPDRTEDEIKEILRDPALDN